MFRLSQSRSSSSSSFSMMRAGQGICRIDFVHLLPPFESDHPVEHENDDEHEND